MKAWLFTILLLAICGCRPTTPVSSELTPQQHFDEAQKLNDAPENLPLAIWHYQEFLDDAPHTQPETPDVTLAKLQLAQCRDRYFALYAPSTASGAAWRDLELKNRILEQRIADQNTWITRLTTENLALRQALLQTQQQPK